jgi:hypothetical protein
MKVSNKGWDERGNAQAVANEAHFIQAADVTDQANDKRQAVQRINDGVRGFVTEESAAGVGTEMVSWR